MSQQPLDLRIPPRYDYGAWVRHPGVEAAQNRLALWLVHGGRIWLTSREPAGKTHLLHLLKSEHPHLGLLGVGCRASGSPVRLVHRWLGELEGRAAWMVDVAGGPLDYATGFALFHLLERAREMHRPLVISWRGDDAGSAPPELISRMRQMERLELAPPRSDADLRAVLRSMASSMQWRVGDGVLDELITLLPRRLPELARGLQRLECVSMAQRRRMSRAWAARELRGLSTA